MIVLSLFDGMSCGRIALERAGIKVTKYFASEIDKHAIKVSKANWPDIIHIGDVTKVSYCRANGTLYTENGAYPVGKIDLLIGGSPCQDFSTLRALGNCGSEISGLQGDKSGLFYEFLRIKQECSPSNWLLENVRMKKASKAELDSYLGVEGKLIDSRLVSYQVRNRYYWSNITFEIPEDRNISFQDFRQQLGLEKYKLNPERKSYVKMWANGQGKNSKDACANVTHADKIYCLTTKQDRCPNSGLVEYEDFCRYLTRQELEQAQTVPLGYTDVLSYNQACAVLGNGWTVDVIAHIFQGIVVERAEKIAA